MDLRRVDLNLLVTFDALLDERSVTRAAERLAKTLSSQRNIQLLEPPFERIGITETMVWTQRHNDDPGHVWLRERIAAVAGERFA